MSSSLRIRTAVAADLPTIVAFNAAMAQETEGLFLDHARLEAGVRAVLDDPRRGAYWIAEAGGAPVGQTLVTLEWSDWRNADFWWIQSVYVAADHRGQGVYRALHEHVVREARAAGACGVRLYVEHENDRARSVYRHLGMRPAPYEMMEEDFVLRRGADG